MSFQLIRFDLHIDSQRSRISQM